MSTRKPAKRVAIVGGGISGLSAAYFLEQQTESLEIDLFEAQDRLGGKLQTRELSGMTMELGAESFLSRKPQAVGLCEQIGIHQDLRGTNPETKRTFVWHGDRLHRLPEGLSGFVPSKLSSLSSTTLLNWFGKLRVGLDFVLPERSRDEDESIASFISRRLGTQAYRRLVQPLLCGIYCGDGKDLSLNATFPELKKLVLEHGSLIRGLGARSAAAQNGPASLPPFVTLPGGMSDLIRATHTALKRTQVQLSKPISKVTLEPSIELSFPNDPTGHAYDAVIFTTSSAITSKMLDPRYDKLKSAMGAIPHVSTATVNLWYDAQEFDGDINGYGFVIPSDQQKGITAVTWTSSKHFDRAPKDTCLIRAYVGRAGDELTEETSDEEILAVVARELRRTMGVQAKPTGSLITRWMAGSPQYTLGHPQRLATIDQELERLPGFFVCGSSYRGVGIPDCIRESKRAAQNTIDFLNLSS